MELEESCQEEFRRQGENLGESAASSSTGDLFRAKPTFCRINRETLKYGIYIMSQLTGEDIAWLRQEKILSASTPNFDFRRKLVIWKRILVFGAERQNIS